MFGAPERTEPQCGTYVGKNHASVGKPDITTDTEYDSR